MKITAITPYLMQAGAPGETAWSAAGMSSAGSRHWCFVKVETDTGVHGIGEGSGWPKVVATAIADLATLLIGQDARDIDRLWHRMFVAQMGHGRTGVVGAGAIGAIDMALWDLNAKALGVPLHRLLGGRFRDRVRAYVHASSVETARDAVAQGFTAVKAGNPRDAQAKVAALRTALGPGIDIAVDLHGPPWLTAPDAIRLARALEPHDLLFLEEPVAPEDLDGLRRVRAATGLPLAAGERLSLLWGFRTLIGEGLVDIVQPDTGRVGGLTQLRKIAALAEAHFIQVAPHSGTLGPVAEFAAIHFLASIPNALIHERFLTDWPGRQAILTHSLETVDGHMLVPDRPGLGTDLLLDEIARHPPGTNIAADSAKHRGSYEAGTADEGLYTQPRRARAAFFTPE
ncbi:mandelate racemase/muconate lactonizing enzyme family protein [Sandaracinobacteroides saxicola]|uniref:Mandelate racemase/muconate lactonizing enzyme family protein n=1 Tax=Sandaracinobacteroides saxicola TaxID=2759707 RepID=A0A7G5IM59_9SPHN|nr:mandelate racemase/muconate lactonizing enzyme family protein [Sandaracinobacteroides saxicola]QMW24451.1 mandelate racemase/muconate lactonizing enzyme family protein [Sandaracinobacteroides saxicola]